MNSREIPRDSWRRELDDFSRRHEGCVARVSITTADGKAHTEARDLPLQGVSSDSPRSSAIAIELGDRPDDHLTHEVNSPVSVSIEGGGQRDEAALRIKSADGTTVQLECREHRPIHSSS
jgi:Family of unknown function (DUF5335)